MDEVSAYFTSNLRPGSLAERAVEAAGAVLSTVGYLLGPVCVLIAVTLITCVVWVYFTILFPFHCPELFSISTVVHLCIAFWLLINLTYNYGMCIFTPAGEPPDVVDLEEGRRGSRGNSYVRYCHTCKKPKPSRAHHCAICNKCILKMDHHCHPIPLPSPLELWRMSNKGFHNHKYFILFLLWMSIATLYVSLMAFTPFNLQRQHILALGSGSGSIVAFVFLLTSCICVAVSLMCAWHIYLAGSAQTTIEFYKNRMDSMQASSMGMRWANAYHVGWRENWDVVFGPNSWPFRWLLPSSRKPGVASLCLVCIILLAGRQYLTHNIVQWVMAYTGPVGPIRSSLLFSLLSLYMMEFLNICKRKCRSQAKGSPLSAVTTSASIILDN